MTHREAKVEDTGQDRIGPLRRPGVAAVLAAEVVSITGSQMSALALPWFVLATTHSTARMGLVAAVEMLAMALFAVPGGGLSARLGAWKTLWVSDGVRGVLVALVPLLHQLGLLVLPVLLVIVFFVGGFFAPYSAAQGVLLTDVVGEDERRVSEVSSWLQAATRLTIMIGPALAGVLITMIGAPNLLWIDAGTFLIAFALVRWFAPSSSPSRPTRSSGSTTTRSWAECSSVSSARPAPRATSPRPG